METKIRLSDSIIRQHLFKEILIKRGIQQNYTPEYIVDKMLDKVDLENQTIMILFNLEILERLYERNLLDKNKITFISDDNIKTRIAKVFYKVQVLQYDAESWTKNLEKIVEDIMIKMNKAPDITFTNPPWHKGSHLRILLALNEKKLFKKLVCVNPANWLLCVNPIRYSSERQKNNIFKVFREAFEKYTIDLEIFNGNSTFNIAVFHPCVITTIDMSEISKIKNVTSFGKNYIVSSFDDITIHGAKWDPIVKDFQNRVSEYCNKHGNLHSHFLHDSNNIDSKKYQIQLAAIRGHVTFDTDINKMFTDDFFTIVQKKPENNKGIRNNNQFKFTMLQVDSQQEQDSLLIYLQLDFVRLCLSLLKLGQDIVQNRETILVPWMDFTHSWNDDKLFSELGYHKGHAIREYAKEFLPDYHNLYHNGKTY